MAVTKYQYDITDTVDDAVNISLLTNQIDADAAIGVPVDPTEAMDVGTEAGKLDIYMADALTAPQKTALDATVAAHQATVTLLAYRYWESAAVQSTPSGSWQEAFSKVATPTTQGEYLISWYAEMRVIPGLAASAGEAQLRVDGSVRSSAYCVTEAWTGFSGWDRMFMGEGDTPTLDIRYRRAPELGGDGTIEIRRLKMGMEFMGATT